MDAQQEFFTAIKLALEEKGYAVYDGALPPEDTPYPFIYLGDFRQTDTEHKNAVTGTVYPMIHVWHNDIRKRGTVSAMLLDVKTVCRNLAHTANFAWLVRNVNARIIADKTTKTPLLHGVVEAECLFS
jgi:hypothetical protein